MATFDNSDISLSSGVGNPDLNTIAAAVGGTWVRSFTLTGAVVLTNTTPTRARMNSLSTSAIYNLTGKPLGAQYEVIFKFRYVTAAIAADNLGPLACMNGVGSAPLNYYAFEFLGNTGKLRFYKQVASSATFFTAGGASGDNPPIAMTAGNSYWLRLRVSPTQVRADVSADGSAYTQFGTTQTDASLARVSSLAGIVGFAVAANDAAGLQMETFSAADWNVTTITPDNADWVFPNEGWRPFGTLGVSGKQCNMAGNYFKIGIAVAAGGAGNCVLNIACPASTNVFVAWSRDDVNLSNDVPYQLATLSSASTALDLVGTGLQLSANANHAVFWYVKYFDITQDRWLTPAEAVKITGITIDADASVISSASLPFFPKQGKKSVDYGDSIQEGSYNINRTITTSDGLYTVAAMVSRAVGAEYSQLAAASTSYANGSGGGAGNIPAMWVGDGSGRYLRYDANAIITPQAMDYVFDYHGHNDVASPATLISNLYPALRTAYPAPCKIIKVIPFGGQQRTNITSAISTYAGGLTATVVDANITVKRGVTDTNCWIIDLGAGIFQQGLTQLSPTTGATESTDQVHPYAAYNGFLAAAVARGVGYIEGVSSGGGGGGGTGGTSLLGFPLPPI